MGSFSQVLNFFKHPRRCNILPHANIPRLEQFGIACCMQLLHEQSNSVSTSKHPGSDTRMFFSCIFRVMTDDKQQRWTEPVVLKVIEVTSTTVSTTVFSLALYLASAMVCGTWVATLRAG